MCESSIPSLLLHSFLCCCSPPLFTPPLSFFLKSYYRSGLLPELLLTLLSSWKHSVKPRPAVSYTNCQAVQAAAVCPLCCCCCCCPSLIHAHLTGSLFVCGSSLKSCTNPRFLLTVSNAWLKKSTGCISIAPSWFSVATLNALHYNKPSCLLSPTAEQHHDFGSHSAFWSEATVSQTYMVEYFRYK